MWFYYWYFLLFRGFFSIVDIFNIAGAELVGPSKRVLSAALISSCYTFGEVFVALVSWYFKSWRLEIRFSEIGFC